MKKIALFFILIPTFSICTDTKTPLKAEKIINRSASKATTKELLIEEIAKDLINDPETLMWLATDIVEERIGHFRAMGHEGIIIRAVMSAYSMPAPKPGDSLLGEKKIIRQSLSSLLKWQKSQPSVESVKEILNSWHKEKLDDKEFYLAKDYAVSRSTLNKGVTKTLNEKMFSSAAVLIAIGSFITAGSFLAFLPGMYLALPVWLAGIGVMGYSLVDAKLTHKNLKIFKTLAESTTAQHERNSYPSEQTTPLEALLNEYGMSRLRAQPEENFVYKVPKRGVKSLIKRIKFRPKTNQGFEKLKHAISSSAKPKTLNINSEAKNRAYQQFLLIAAAAANINGPFRGSDYTVFAAIMDALNIQLPQPTKKIASEEKRHAIQEAIRKEIINKL